MKNANNACLLEVTWQGWANLIHSFLNFSFSLPLQLCDFLTLPATLSFVHHPQNWLGEGEGEGEVG